MRAFLQTLIFFLYSGLAIAQTDSIPQQNPLQISAFIDTYYAYDFTQPAKHARPNFTYHHDKDNEFAINLALVSAQYESENYRGNLGVMFGTYAEANLAHEHPIMQHIYEAYAGVKIVDNLWLDAGIFSSHLGFASAISSENYTLTRSLSAESSPYYLAGAKLTWQPNDKWTLSGTICNGWQNMRETANNSNKALGTQVVYSPSSKVSLNYSTFFGNEATDDAKQYRLFHNLFGSFELHPNLHFIVGFDYGTQEKTIEDGTDNWWVASSILHYKISELFAVAARVESIQDDAEIVASTDYADGFQVTGLSLNLDYQPVTKVLLRAEGRLFTSDDDIFEKDGSLVSNNTAITISLAVKY